MSECCSHLFCKSDLEQMKATKALSYACPMCRVKQFTSYANKAIDRETKELQDYCPNKKDGCDWIGELGHVDTHLDKCEITCSKCQEQIHNTAMSTHTSSECPCYCQYCDTTAGREVISAQHKEKCHNYLLPCPNKCGLGSIPRCDMDEHRQVCPLECPQSGVELARKDQEVHNKNNKLEHSQLVLDKQVTTLQKTIAKANQESNTNVDALVVHEPKKTVNQLLFNVIAVLCLTIVILIAMLVYTQMQVTAVNNELQEMKQIITLLQVHPDTEETDDRREICNVTQLFSRIDKILTSLKVQHDQLITAANTTSNSLLTNLTYIISELVAVSRLEQFENFLQQIEQINSALLELISLQPIGASSLINLTSNISVTVEQLGCNTSQFINGALLEPSQAIGNIKLLTQNVTKLVKNVTSEMLGQYIVSISNTLLEFISIEDASLLSNLTHNISTIMVASEDVLQQIRHINTMLSDIISIQPIGASLLYNLTHNISTLVNHLAHNVSQHFNGMLVELELTPSQVIGDTLLLTNLTHEISMQITSNVVVVLQAKLGADVLPQSLIEELQHNTKLMDDHTTLLMVNLTKNIYNIVTNKVTKVLEKFCDADKVTTLPKQHKEMCKQQHEKLTQTKQLTLQSSHNEHISQVTPTNNKLIQDLQTIITLSKNMTSCSNTWPLSLLVSDMLSCSVEDQILPVILKVSNFTEKMKNKHWEYSKPFLAFDRGYRMQLRVDTAGHGDGTHISVYLYLMKGPYDDALQWPLRGTCTIELLNQLNDDNHHSHTVSFHSTDCSECTNRVIDGDKAPTGLGIPHFISHSTILHDVNGGYLRANKVYFKVSCPDININRRKNPPKSTVMEWLQGILCVSLIVIIYFFIFHSILLL